MKNIFLIFIFLIGSMGLFAQKFTVQVSTDSILYGNYFEVKFTLENASGGNFNAPPFENFNVVSGPNTATSMSFMNGQMTQSLTYTYYLEPKEIGNYYIQPASIEINNEILETLPLEVMVVPNPDGIQQPSQSNRPSNSLFDNFFSTPPSFEADPNEMQEFFNGQDFFNFDMNDLNQLLEQMPNFQFDIPMPDQSIPEETPNENSEPKKKKRKTVRI